MPCAVDACVHAATYGASTLSGASYQMFGRAYIDHGKTNDEAMRQFDPNYPSSSGVVLFSFVHLAEVRVEKEYSLFTGSLQFGAVDVDSPTDARAYPRHCLRAVAPVLPISPLRRHFSWLRVAAMCIGALSIFRAM
jgi:hypothetical protein